MTLFHLVSGFSFYWDLTFIKMIKVLKYNILIWSLFLTFLSSNAQYSSEYYYFSLTTL